MIYSLMHLQNITFIWVLFMAMYPSPFYRTLTHTDNTAMAPKLPLNAMRDLDEFQGETKCLMMANIDLELVSVATHTATFTQNMMNFRMIFCSATTAAIADNALDGQIRIEFVILNRFNPSKSIRGVQFNHKMIFEVLIFFVDLLCAFSCVSGSWLCII
eukprot:33966_1